MTILRCYKKKSLFSNFIQRPFINQLLWLECKFTECRNEVSTALGCPGLKGFLECETCSAKTGKVLGKREGVGHLLQESGLIRFTFILAAWPNCLMHNKWLININ